MKHFTKASLVGFTALALSTASFADTQATTPAQPSKHKPAKTQKASLLFVLAAPQAKVTVQGNQATLTLSPIQHAMYFTDRPMRKSGGIPIEKFVNNIWNHGGKDSLRADSPNGALVAAVDTETENYHNDTFLVLSNPQYDKSTQTISFTAQSLNKKVPITAETLKETVLFVDDYSCTDNNSSECINF